MALNTADPGQTMTVNFTVENEGGQVDEQDIKLTLENGNKTTLDQLDNVSLQGGESNQYSLVWDIPSDQEEKLYDLSVETDDDVDVFWDPLGLFNAKDGTGVETVWTHGLHNKGVRSVTLSNGIVYSTQSDNSAENRAYGADIEDGSEIVQLANDSADRPPNSIDAVDGIVYAGYENGKVSAIDGLSGLEIWSHDLMPQAVSDTTGIASDGDIVCSTPDSDTKAVVYDIEDQSLFFEQSVGYTSSTYIDDDYLYIASGERVRAYDKSTGDVVWSSASNYSSVLSMGSDESVLVASDSVDYVVGYDKADGSRLWRHSDIGDRPYGTVVMGEVAYIATWNGNILASDRDDGSKIWKQSITGDRFAGMDGLNNMLYVGDTGASGADRVRKLEIQT